MWQRGRKFMQVRIPNNLIAGVRGSTRKFQICLIQINNYDANYADQDANGPTLNFR